MPPMPPDMMQGQPQAPGPDDQSPQGMSVTITKMPDGTFSVGPDDDSQGGEQVEGGQPEGQEPGMQTVKSLDEALSLAGQMLSGGPDRGEIAKQVWST